ncbi:MAG: tryptophan-rich sensory protein [Bacteriovoracaceae bacterium]|nr:tryptophan-rich sensory protein [Bacteriovoracaceae bacterium]
MPFTFKRFLRFILCLIPPYIAAISGVFFRPGIWYQGIVKPWWTPPPLTFPIVWNILYLFMAWTFFILWEKSQLRGRLGLIYSIQLLLNLIWSPVFFGAHWTLLGAFIIACMLGLVSSFIYITRHSFALWGPNLLYLIWLMIAFSLNLSIIILN